MTGHDATIPRRVLIVSASVGAGHDGAAAELGHRLAARGVLTETRDFLDALPAWLRYTVREGYTGTVTHTPWFYDWLYAAMERRGPIQRIGLLVCRTAQRRVLRWCADVHPDAVVSTYPLASQTLGQLVKKGRIAVPTATFLTDPSVHALWVHRHIHRHLTTTPATAEIGERHYRVPMTVAGPLVPVRFRATPTAVRETALLTELGIDPGRAIALVVTGSLGLGRVVETVDAILATGVAVPLVLCGRNDRLLGELASRPGVLAFGWRDDVHDLMHVCDVLVHNAGGLSFSESLVAGLPAVTYACIPGHGKANGDVLDRAGIAPLARTEHDLGRALQRQLLPAARDTLRVTVAAAERDASQLVLDDLHDRAAETRLEARRRRRRHTSHRRLISGLGAAALVAVTSVGATEGVSAAASHGFDVARLPAHSVALVVEPDSLRAAGRDAAVLRSRSAAVVVPSTLTPSDVRAAAELSSAGVPLLSRGCSAVSLLHHARSAQRCGSARALAEHAIPVSPVVVSFGEVEALDLVVAKRDATRIVLARVIGSRSRPTTATPEGVWVIRQGSGSARILASDVRRVGGRVMAGGSRLRPVTDARGAR